MRSTWMNSASLCGYHCNTWTLGSAMSSNFHTCQKIVCYAPCYASVRPEEHEDACASVLSLGSIRHLLIGSKSDYQILVSEMCFYRRNRFTSVILIKIVIGQGENEMNSNQHSFCFCKQQASAFINHKSETVLLPFLT